MSNRLLLQGLQDYFTPEQAYRGLVILVNFAAAKAGPFAVSEGWVDLRKEFTYTWYDHTLTMWRRWEEGVEV